MHVFRIDDLPPLSEGHVLPDGVNLASLPQAVPRLHLHRLLLLVSQGGLATRLLQHLQELAAVVGRGAVVAVHVAALEDDGVVLEGDGHQPRARSPRVVGVGVDADELGLLGEEPGVHVPTEAREHVGHVAEARAELVAHPAQNDGVVAGVGHGQPVEQGPQVLDVGPAVDVVDLPHNLWEEGDTASLIMRCC